VLDALAPAGASCRGKPCWTSTERGFRYVDRRAVRDGLLRLRLKSGDAGRAAVLVLGRGDDLRVPSLPLVPPLTVQLRPSSGVCWDADYATLRRNSAAAVRGSID
jgi:hypothetical protein